MSAEAAAAAAAAAAVVVKKVRNTKQVGVRTKV
jgi:hypothetical protein